jgi:O-antigen/teichoic acid export membrane protein
MVGTEDSGMPSEDLRRLERTERIVRICILGGLAFDVLVMGMAALFGWIPVALAGAIAVGVAVMELFALRVVSKNYDAQRRAIATGQPSPWA